MNIEELQDEFFRNLGIENDFYAEQLFISTSQGDIIKIDSPSTNPTSSLFCEFDQSITDIAVDADQQITFTAGNFTTVDENCIFDFYIYSAFEVNSLSFDNLGYMYYGYGAQSRVMRVQVQNGVFNGGLWHDFGTGASAGDFVYLNGKIYVAWRLNSNYRLYEVTVDDNNNYISHIDLGQIPDKTFGLATEYGKLYGVTIDTLYDINLDTFTFTDIYFNDNPSNDWYGAAGLHEAVVFDISTHSSLADAENSTNALSGNWTNTLSGGQTIYIRLENIYSGDYDIYTVVINIKPFPNVNPPNDLNQCLDIDFNVFDLNQVIPQMQIDEEDDLSFTFYNKNPFLHPQAEPISYEYQSTSQTQTLFVSVELNNNGCPADYSFRILNNPTPDLLPFSNTESPTTLTSCYFDDNF